MDTLEQELQQQITEYTKEKERWESEKRQAEEKLVSIERDLSSFQNALTAYQRKIGSDTSSPLQVTLDASRFQGKTFIDSFKIIARENSGRIRITDAVKTLTEAGRIKPETKNPYGMVSTMLYRSKKNFVKSGKGEYRLTESAQ